MKQSPWLSSVFQSSIRRVCFICNPDKWQSTFQKCGRFLMTSWACLCLTPMCSVRMRMIYQVLKNNILTYFSYFSFKALTKLFVIFWSDGAVWSGRWQPSMYCQHSHRSHPQPGSGHVSNSKHRLGSVTSGQSEYSARRPDEPYSHGSSCSCSSSSFCPCGRSWAGCSRITIPSAN